MHAPSNPFVPSDASDALILGTKDVHVDMADFVYMYVRHSSDYEWRN